MNKTIKRLKERRTFSFISFCILLILISIVISAIYRAFIADFNKEKNQILLNDELLIFNQIIEQQIYDTMLLSELCNEVLLKKPYDYDTLITTIAKFNSNRPYYLQVRFISPDKMEQVVYRRDENENYILEIPEDKSSRYYLRYPFTNDRQIYLSKLDLNIENNKIEIPYNPVLRSVKPLYNESTLIGYIVLNFEMNETIKRMKNYSPGTKQSYIINDNGDWLVGPETVNTWGFLYDDIENYNISTTHPQLWKSINENQINFFSDIKNNIFTTSTIIPKLKTHENQIEIITEETWIYMIHTNFTSSILKFNLILSVIVLILITTTSIVYKSILVREKEKNDAYNALIEEQEKFHIISNTVGVSIILINSQGETKYWNQAAFDTFGYTEEEVIGRNIHTLIASEHDALSAKVGMEKFSHSGSGPFIGNTRLVKAIRKDRSTFSAELSIRSTMVKNEYWAVGIINDVSEREKSLLELRKLSQAVKISKDIIFITDAHGKIEYINHAFETITGYNSKEAIGQTPTIIHSEAKQNVCFKELLKTADAEGSVSEIIVNKRKDGSLFYYDQTISVVYDDEGNIKNYISTGKDITERITIQEQLETTLETMEKTIEERTESLQMAKDDAEKANLAKSAFLANMSHEIRTPLNAIIGFSQILLRDKVLDDIYKEKIEAIFNSGEHLLELINNILTISKIEAGRLEVTSNKMLLSKLLSEIEGIFTYKAEENSIDLIFENHFDKRTNIDCDVLKLKQCIINLLGNALKFTYRGFVKVSTEITDEALRCSIKDTGPGITNDDIYRIFHPFEQVESQSQKYTGTGLGLSITQKFITHMGGQLGVESKINEGSTFYFTIPVTTSYREIDTAQENDKNYELLVEQPIDVMIVDDKKSNLMLLKAMLENKMISITSFENGKDAVEACKQKLPDIILMDLKMPIMDGYEAISIIRETISQGLLIAAVTASVFEDEKQNILDAGFNAVIRKPFKIYSIESFLAQHEHVHIKTLDNDEVNVTNSNSSEDANTLNNLAVNYQDEDIEKLRYATELGDVDLINQTLDNIENFPTSLRKKIITYCTNFDFESLLTLLNQLD